MCILHSLYAFFLFSYIMQSTYHIAVSLIFINNQIFLQKTAPIEIVTDLQPVSRWLSGQVSSMFDKIAFCWFFPGTDTICQYPYNAVLLPCNNAYLALTFKKFTLTEVLSSYLIMLGFVHSHTRQI